jgi:3-oxoacyl-[acyl-carrier protein] reductase
MSEARVAVVTGGSRGIGREIAIQLAAAGNAVAVIATKLENTAATVEAIRQAGGVAHGFGCDVSNSADAIATLEKVTADMGAPGILVNNAGITRDTLMLRMDDDQWNQVIAVNLTGAYNMTKACLKGMMKARWGRVINISSVIGLHGGAGQANYAAAKAGLVGLTLSTAKEVGSRGITANVIAPGFIETDMTSDLPEAMMESVTKTAPIGRLGTPSDVAPIICFLASDLASYITGQVISVDGGLYL